MRLNPKVAAGQTCLLLKPGGAGVWLHGEAVAAGMVMAADMSVRLGWIEEEILHRTVALLEKAELPTRPPKVPSPDVFGQAFPCQVVLLWPRL